MKIGAFFIQRLPKFLSKTSEVLKLRKSANHNATANPSNTKVITHNAIVSTHNAIVIAYIAIVNDNIGDAFKITALYLNTLAV